MRKAGQSSRCSFGHDHAACTAGVSTDHLNQLCHDFIIENDAIPAPLNYRGFPKSTCISINHVVCHGIPDEKTLRDGDILNIDITVILDGWYGDTSRMFYVWHTICKGPATNRSNI